MIDLVSHTRETVTLGKLHQGPAPFQRQHADGFLNVGMV
jgi:hypothetical protein